MNHLEALGLLTELKEEDAAARTRRAALLNNLGAACDRAVGIPEDPFDYAAAHALLEGAEREEAKGRELAPRIREVAAACGRRG